VISLVGCRGGGLFLLPRHLPQRVVIERAHGLDAVRPYAAPCGVPAAALFAAPACRNAANSEEFVGCDESYSGSYATFRKRSHQAAG
jgi:hypothetical protein